MPMIKTGEMVEVGVEDRLVAPAWSSRGGIRASASAIWLEPLASNTHMA